MNILVAAHPFDGHFNPLSALAVHLQGIGHDVRFYTGASYAARLAQLGLLHLPFVRALELHTDNLAEQLGTDAGGPQGPRAMEEQVRRLFFAPIEPMLRDIEAIHATFPFDAFICDAALYVAPLVAETLQQCTYVVAPTLSPAPTSPQTPAPFFGFHPARGPLGRLRDRVCRGLIERSMRSGRALVDDLRRREGLAPYRGSWFDAHVRFTRQVFQIGVPGVDFERTDRPSNMRFVGALTTHRHGARARGLPAALADKVARHERVVVVSQGTTDNRDPTKLLAPALEAFGGQRDGTLVVAATCGRHTDALRARFGHHGNVVVEDWVDYAALLPSTAALITNAGFGTVMTALSHGVPLVCAGKSEEKADIAARVAWRGLGVDLRTDRPRAAALRAAVGRVVDDAALHARVAAVRAEIARYDACAIIEGVLVDDGIVPTPVARAATAAG